MEDFDGRISAAIDEFIRYTSPVMTFRRTAVEASRTPSSAAGGSAPATRS